MSLTVPVWIIAIFAIGILINNAAAIFLWLICSFFLFAFIDPLLQRLNKKGISTLISSITLISIATLFLLGLAFLIYQNIPGMVVLLKGYQVSVSHLIASTSQNMGQWLDRFSSIRASPPPPSSSGNPLHLPQGAELGDMVGSHLLRGLGTALTIFTFGIMCPILTFFIIADRTTFACVLAKIYKTPEEGAHTWKKICDAVTAYFLGNLVIGAVTWPLFTLLFYCFGVGNPLLLAAMASVLNLVPFVGAVLSWLIPALDLLTKAQGLGNIAGLAAICVFIHFAVANFVTPKVLGSKLDLNATTSTIALIVWGEIWGGLGLLLAIPVTATIKILMEQSGHEHLKWLSMLMSESPNNMLKTTYKRIFLTKDEAEAEEIEPQA